RTWFLSVLDQGGRRFAHFELRSHTLDLFRLLLELRSQLADLRFLQGNPGRLFFGGGLQFLHQLLLFQQLIHRQWRISGHGAQFTVRIDHYRHAARSGGAENSANVASRNESRIADANRATFARDSSGRAGSDVDVIVAAGEVEPCSVTNGRVEAAVDIFVQCRVTNSHISSAGLDIQKRLAPNALFALPTLGGGVAPLPPIAAKPKALFELPSVLVKSASAPTAVL